LFALCAIPYHQAEALSVSASVSVTIRSITSIALSRDDNSVTRGRKDLIVFDRLDSDDGQANGNPSLMYAPYRSEGGLNWHILEIIANGRNMTLSVACSGNVGPEPLADILKLWCGGLYELGSKTPISKTPSEDWEWANGWERSFTNRGFIGIAPFNYQLNVMHVPAGGPYTGATVTFTVVST
jgi:hypothetical protein